MARPRGFEPLTARFVAEYSIQLSYGRSKNGGEGGIRTLASLFPPNSNGRDNTLKYPDKTIAYKALFFVYKSVRESLRGSEV